MLIKRTMYFKLYPSDVIPPLSGDIKAHKPEKNYHMRTLVSTIPPLYGVIKVHKPEENYHMRTLV